MSQSPFEHSESLKIGTVDFVSPDEIKVALDIHAPESVAMNTGSPRPFPRVSGYVLVCVDDCFVVGQIEWLTVERSSFPKRRGMQDFGLVDLPFPLRKMSLSPLGTLRKAYDSLTGNDVYKFRRGADSLPSIGAGVQLPTDEQLRSIVESADRRRVKVGTSPLAGNADVCIDPDRLFGRHLAVLGNTGSGKSCSVAGLIRWSLEQATKNQVDGLPPNARFIVLDPNGEYSRAFSDRSIKARVFKVEPESGESLLQVPLWFWNSAEWGCFTQATTKTQKPTLVQALRAVRDGHTELAGDRTHEIRRFLRTIVATIRLEKNAGDPWQKFPRPRNFYLKLEKWRQGLESLLAETTGPEHDKLNLLIEVVERLCSDRRPQYSHYDFTLQEVEHLLTAASAAHSAFGGSDEDVEPSDVDAPIAFSGDAFLRSVEATAEMLNVSEHVETLLIRIRSLLANARLKPVISQTDDISLESWLTAYVGADQASNGCVSILDVSLVPTEVIHVITAVVARVVFESLQRYRKTNGRSLPTVLVMEEAHTFIKRYKEDVENPDAASICCQVFERIAREGRKFGLGLVISSQRPSELSPTVLSQCNSFLLHRISNDRDQELVNRLVPDNLRGLLRELPSLPSQNAILMGWASELPVLIKMNDLPLPQQPHSDDPDFWDVWTRRDVRGNNVERRTNWKLIANDWQGHSQNDLLVERLCGMTVEARRNKIEEILEPYVSSLALGNRAEVSKAMAETNASGFEIGDWGVSNTLFEGGYCRIEVEFSLIGTQIADMMITSNRIEGRMIAVIADDGSIMIEDIVAGVDYRGWGPDEDTGIPF
jgi:DNA helicase HerA-like ATPase